jgi:hypothetical protein
MHMSQDLHRQAVAQYNQGCALQAGQEWEAAISCYDEALALEPNLAPAYSNRGAAFAAMNRCDEALASLAQAIKLVPDYPQAHFSRAVALLLQGDLPNGWIEFEWRWKTVPGRTLRQSKNFPQPLWRGADPVAGKTLLLYCERGLGDTLQFCRYALMVAQLSATVILQVQAPLVALLRSLSQDIRVVSETEPLPRFDLQCPLLSLPLMFNTSLDTIPAQARYLGAVAGKVAQVRAKLSDVGAAGGGARRSGARSDYVRRVGVVWRGDASNPDDSNRSIELRNLLSCLPPGLQYVSLQKAVTPAEQSLIEAHPLLTFLDDESGFEDTAALCECLDLVVAVDTSVAHLAAALGLRTWILLPFNPDCRWLLDRQDSPWYPTVELYRQRFSGDWSGVLARIRDDLGRLL